MRQETETGDRDRNRDKTEDLRPSSRIALITEGKPIASGECEPALEGRNAIEVFADGACEPNPGPGAWAFVVYRNGKEEHSASGADLDTTNNRMELTAALRALEWIGANASPSQASLQSDSEYAVKGCNEWRHRWKAKGWRKNGADIPNADLWRLLDAALEAQPSQLRWVRGHAGNIGNERADALASEALHAAKLSDGIPDDAAKHPVPVLMFPSEVINLKTAEHIAGRDRRTVCRMIEVHGLGHQVNRNAPWRISGPALVLYIHGDLKALEALRSGDREHPNVVRAIDHAGRINLLK